MNPSLLIASSEQSCYTNTYLVVMINTYQVASTSSCHTWYKLQWYFCFQPATNEVPYTGNIADENFFQVWANDKCVPLVREITFENAEVSNL